MAAIEAGRHVLIEKPIALDLATADQLIAKAAAAGVTLQIGHQERYVADAFGLFDRGSPLALRSRRLNKFSGRAMDVSVVLRFDGPRPRLARAICPDAERGNLSYRRQVDTW